MLREPNIVVGIGIAFISACNSGGSGGHLTSRSNRDCNQNGIPDGRDLLPGIGFSMGVTYGDGTRQVPIAAADFDSDGDQDIVVGASYILTDSGPFPDASPCKVSLLLNRGNGTFADPSVVVKGPRPANILTADFDGNGLPDLAVAFAGTCCPFTGGTISILLNRGGGSFAEKVDFAKGSHAGSLAAGDIDGDADPDIVAAQHGNSTDQDDGSILVLLNRGNGEFTNPSEFGA